MYLLLDNLVKVFPSRAGSGDVAAVDGVSLQIERGELVTLLGPSGCGKTTTLRMIAGFEFPTSGRILLDGAVVNDLPPHRRDMSMVFQSYAIFPHLNVFENVAYGLNVQHLPSQQIKQRVAKVLELVELTGLEHRAPNQLSGGQQQRVALARALVMEPKVLLMDEPLSNLDAKLREQMRGEIRRIQKRLGITSVYVTHDQTEAMTLSDRIVIMNAGKIDQIGAPLEVYRRPSSRFVADFIGRANFVEATVRALRPGTAEVAALGCILNVPLPERACAPGDRLTLVMRPEMVHVRAPGEAPGNPLAETSATVVRTAYLGSLIEYDLQVGDTILSVVEHDPRQAVIHAEGEAVIVSILEDCLFALPEV
jgi:iron(III) transport system ATP-binding protein